MRYNRSAAGSMLDCIAAGSAANRLHKRNARLMVNRAFLILLSEWFGLIALLGHPSMLAAWLPILPGVTSGLNLLWGIYLY